MQSSLQDHNDDDDVVFVKTVPAVVNEVQVVIDNPKSFSDDADYEMEQCVNLCSLHFLSYKPPCPLVSAGNDDEGTSFLSFLQKISFVPLQPFDFILSKSLPSPCWDCHLLLLFLLQS